MAIKQIHTSTSNRPLAFFFHYATDDDGIDLDSPYQRGDTWSLTRRRNLLYSLLSGIPVPAIVINDRYAAKFKEESFTSERNQSYSVVDGKQRVTTLLMFAKDRFGIPTEWLHSDEIDQVSGDGLVYWSGLSKGGQIRFKINCTIGVVEGRMRTLEEEAKLFDLVNFGGVPQGETDDEPFGWES